jgi:hypothetical protein
LELLVSRKFAQRRKDLWDRHLTPPRHSNTLDSGPRSALANDLYTAGVTTKKQRQEMITGAAKSKIGK